MESGPARIDRLNRSRNVTLEVELNGRSLGEVNTEARALPALRNLPASVTIAELGDAEEMRKLFASFGTAMLIGVLCIYGVLVLLFTYVDDAEHGFGRMGRKLRKQPRQRARSEESTIK